MVKWMIGVAAAVFAAQASAESPAAPATPDVVAAIAAHSLPIEAGSGVYGGPGWRALLDSAGSAQFFIAGEQHGSASIAQLEVALQKALMIAGFTHTALEIGPHSAAEAVRMERAKPGSVAGYLAEDGNGFAIPFLFVKPEMPLLTQAIALSPDRDNAVWGLDQEFIGGASLLAGVLVRDARTSEQRAAAGRFAAAARAEPFYLVKAPEAELATLEAAFAGNRSALGILADIRASRAIYAPFTGGGGPIYPANLARETMMKRNFQRQFEDAERRLGKAPRVFFKFGGSHAMRGHSLTDVPALGNFIAEWGGSRGFRAVNLLIDCDRGESLNPQTSKAEPCESAAQGAPTLLAAAHQGPPLQVIDLAALRPELGKLKGLDPETRRLILAFDYYVPVRGGSASVPIGVFPTQ